MFPPAQFGSFTFHWHFVPRPLDLEYTQTLPLEQDHARTDSESGVEAEAVNTGLASALRVAIATAIPRLEPNLTEILMSHPPEGSAFHPVGQANAVLKRTVEL